MADSKKKRKELEKENELLLEKLKISKSLVKIGFWELNRDTLEMFLSNEALGIIRLKSNKQIINIDEFANIVSVPDRAIFLNEIKKLTTGTTYLNIEFVLNQKISEKELVIKAIASGAEKSKRNPNIILGIVQDITEQKRAEELLKKAKNKAEESDFLKSAFLANMSHEIRTPLNAILGFSRLLTNQNLEDSQRSRYSEYITSSANNLLNLIKDIIDISKIEAGKISIEKKRCEVNKILNELKFTFEKEKHNQSKNHIQIKLRQADDEENFAINTDPFRFHQILVNLIGNALKFIEKGNIEFGYIKGGEKLLQFYVKDTGIGIPEDKAELIFSRFGQIINNKIKNPGGTGLGLSITKHLVEKLGGKIWVESEIGVGTTFSFTLPFDQTGITDSKLESSAKKVNYHRIKDIKILAVEDDPINMVLLEDILHLHIENLQIEKAYNGLEALQKFEASDFDLIIMDIRMPKIDGYETTKHIRKEFPHPKNNIPILGLSAHAIEDETEKGKKIGMDDFLAKPIQPEELYEKINKLIAQKFIRKSEQDKNSDDNELFVRDELLDLSFFIKLFKNNTDKIHKTLKVYLDQVPEQLKLLEAASANGQKEQQKTIAHSLKSTFKYLGRADISEHAREVEINTEIKAKEEYVNETINKIIKEWHRLEKRIKEYMQTSIE